ncbi:MAG: hypothetical protein RL748_1814 [Pseudomonadota bacterium]|jgi:hypothetical protein
MTQHYIMSPLPRAASLFVNTLKMNVHRRLYEAKKPESAIVTPVFISREQRRNFLAQAEIYLQSCPLVNFNERDVALWLVRGAGEDGEFSNRIPDGAGEQQVLYIQGHGAPGKAALADEAGSVIVDLEGIADALKAIDAIPTEITLKCNSCYSGVDDFPVFDSFGAVREWLNTESRVSPFYTGNSLAAGLRNILRRHRGNIFGYLGPTAMNNSLLLMQPDGNYAYDPHMAVALGYRDAFGNVNYFYVRKSQARVLFRPQREREDEALGRDLGLVDD